MSTCGTRNGFFNRFVGADYGTGDFQSCCQGALTGQSAISYMPTSVQDANSFQTVGGTNGAVNTFSTGYEHQPAATAEPQAHGAASSSSEVVGEANINLNANAVEAENN